MMNKYLTVFFVSIFACLEPQGSWGKPAACLPFAHKEERQH